VSESLDDLVRDLETAATRLRAGELPQDEAAALVERCAELAARIGSELDRAGRDAESGTPGEGQEQLL
jgi:hypothetical protein